MTRRAPFTPEQLLPDGAEIKKMREDGRTFAEIGEQYGVTRQAVHKALKTFERRQAEAAEEAEAAKSSEQDS